MSKYIWEYDQNREGLYRIKYTVVYENKTYYYCKRNGTDKLTEINRSEVDFANCRYFLKEKQNVSKNENSLSKEEIEINYKRMTEDGIMPKRYLEIILESIKKDLEENYN